MRSRQWQSKYGGMNASMIGQMKDMAVENRRLKKMYAEMSSKDPPALRVDLYLKS